MVLQEKTSHDRWHAKAGRILRVLRRVWITESGIKEETDVNGVEKELGRKWERMDHNKQ